MTFLGINWISKSDFKFTGFRNSIKEAKLFWNAVLPSNRFINPFYPLTYLILELNLISSLNTNIFMYVFLFICVDIFFILFFLNNISEHYNWNCTKSRLLINVLAVGTNNWKCNIFKTSLSFQYLSSTNDYVFYVTIKHNENNLKIRRFQQYYQMSFLYFIVSIICDATKFFHSRSTNFFIFS